MWFQILKFFSVAHQVMDAMNEEAQDYELHHRLIDVIHTEPPGAT
jgi:hypothetical protein